MRISRICFLNVILLGLFGWTMIAYYNANEEIKISLSNSDGGFLFSLNITPLVLGLIVAGTAAFFITRNQRRQGKGWRAKN